MIARLSLLLYQLSYCFRVVGVAGNRRGSSRKARSNRGLACRAGLTPVEHVWQEWLCVWCHYRIAAFQAFREDR